MTSQYLPSACKLVIIRSGELPNHPEHSKPDPQFFILDCAEDASALKSAPETFEYQLMGLTPPELRLTEDATKQVNSAVEMQGINYKYRLFSVFKVEGASSWISAQVTIVLKLAKLDMIDNTSSGFEIKADLAQSNHLERILDDQNPPDYETVLVVDPLTY